MTSQRCARTSSPAPSNSAVCSRRRSLSAKCATRHCSSRSTASTCWRRVKPGEKLEPAAIRRHGRLEVEVTGDDGGGVAARARGAGEHVRGRAGRGGRTGGRPRWRRAVDSVGDFLFCARLGLCGGAPRRCWMKPRPQGPASPDGRRRRRRGCRIRTRARAARPGSRPPHASTCRRSISSIKSWIALLAAATSARGSFCNPPPQRRRISSFSASTPSACTNSNPA